MKTNRMKKVLGYIALAMVCVLAGTAIGMNWPQATAETEKKSRLEDIRNLMETLKFTAKQMLDALKIPDDKQVEFFPLI